MTIRECIRKYLAENAGVLAVLETDKVFPGKAPTQNNNPLIIVTVVSDVEQKYQGGVSNVSLARLQITTYTDDSDTQERLDKAVRDGLRNLKGIVNTLYIRCTTMDSSTDSSDIPDDGNQKAEYSTRFDYQIWYDYTV